MEDNKSFNPETDKAYIGKESVIVVKDDIGIE